MSVLETFEMLESEADALRHYTSLKIITKPTVILPLSISGLQRPQLTICEIAQH